MCMCIPLSSCSAFNILPSFILYDTSFICSSVGPSCEKSPLLKAPTLPRSRFRPHALLDKNREICPTESRKIHVHFGQELGLSAWDAISPEQNCASHLVGEGTRCCCDSFAALSKDGLKYNSDKAHGKRTINKTIILGPVSDQAYGAPETHERTLKARRKRNKASLTLQTFSTRPTQESSSDQNTVV